MTLKKFARGHAQTTTGAIAYNRAANLFGTGKPFSDVERVIQTVAGLNNDKLTPDGVSLSRTQKLRTLLQATQSHWLYD